MKKYTWLWRATDIGVKGRSMLSFCRMQGIDVILLQLSNKVTADDYKYFISEATKFGIEVHAACGEREWYHPTKYSDIYDCISRVSAYNSRCLSAECEFTGIHFDIEPHSLDEWKNMETRPEVIKNWADTVSTYVVDCRLAGLQLTAAVPLAIAKVEYEGARFSKFMAEQHDKLLVMSYRDFVEGNDSILHHVDLFLQDSIDLYKPQCIVPSVETKISSEGDKVSFHEEGSIFMRKQLDLLHWKLSDHKGYGGYGIHSLEYWMDMSMYPIVEG
ncbi:hypothetical protein D1872_52130 [compost metagenome]